MTLTYPFVGATAGGVRTPGYARYRGRARLGRGAADFERAARELMRWELKTRVGFRVEAPTMAVGADLTILAGPFREPARIVAVVDEPRRRGYAYGTRRGHPVSGEERFTVEWRADDSVWLDIRSFSRPAGRWWLVAPALLLAQAAVRRRYLRALSRSR